MESLSSPFRAPARNLSVVQRKFDPDEHAFYKMLSECMTTERRQTRSGQRGVQELYSRVAYASETEAR